MTPLLQTHLANLDEATTLAVGNVVYELMNESGFLDNGHTFNPFESEYTLETLRRTIRGMDSAQKAKLYAIKRMIESEFRGTNIEFLNEIYLMIGWDIYTISRDQEEE